MNQGYFKLLLLTVLLAPSLHAEDQPLVVASIRQYQIKGESTIHLYLYRLDGKLRKQLTSDPGQDDHSPFFSHDGKSILFSRVTTGAGRPNQSGKYILHLADGTLTRLPDGPAADAAVRDYAPTIETTAYDDLAFDQTNPGVPDPSEGKDAASLTSPDNSAKLIRQNPLSDDVGPVYLLKTNAAAKSRLPSSFPGFVKTEDSFDDLYLAGKEGPFLVGPSHYCVLFMNRHRDSMWVFDVHKKVWHQIQSEWVPGDIYAPQGEAGFYFVRCSMEDLGNTGKTVMSAYLEWWDAHFHRAMLAPPLSVTYGAATYYGNGETSSFVDELRGS